MQDRFSNRKQPEEDRLEGASGAPAERRRRRELLNEQLRAIYDSYAASDVPQRLLDLANQFEQQARHRLEAGRQAAGQTTRPGQSDEDS